MAWIMLAQNMDHWRDIIDTIMYILIPQNATDLNLQLVACQEISSAGRGEVETLQDLHVLNHLNTELNPICQ